VIFLCVRRCSLAVKGLARLIQQLKADDWLGRLIDGFHEHAEAEKFLEPNLEIHPSSAGSDCVRDIQLGMLGHRGPIPARNRRRMDNGTYAHMRWNAYLNDMGLLVAANVRKVETVPFLWSGELDVLVENPATGSHHIGEIKTMNGQRWRRVPPQVPDRFEMTRILLRYERKYVFQLAQYFEKFRYSHALDRECFYLFENTDTQEFKVRYVAFDDDVIAMAFANQLEAQAMLLQGILVDAPFKQKSPPCRACEHEKLCYALQDGDEEAQGWLKGILLRVASGT
jgi:hypothetical protein